MFGRNKDDQKKAAAAQTPETDLNKKFRDEFASAVYGSFFRTAAFDNPLYGDGALEWREAHNVSGFGWRVQTIRRYNDGTEVRESYSSVNAQPAGFLEAVESLAMFESSQIDMGKVPARGADAQSLGINHVRAFAEREGLVFDDKGMPHPTVGGVIMGEGTFSAHAQEDAIKASKMRDRLRMDILGARFRDIDKNIWLKNKVALDSLEQLSNDMNLVYYDLRQTWENVERSYLLAMSNKYPKSLKSSYKDWFHAANRLLADEHKYFGLGSVVDPTLEMAVNAFRFMTFMHIASVTERHVAKGCNCEWDGKRGCDPESVGKFQALGEKMLGRLGFAKEGPVIVNAQTYIMRKALERGNSEYLENLEKVIKHVNAVAAKLRYDLGLANEPVKKASMLENAAQAISDIIWSGPR